MPIEFYAAEFSPPCRATWMLLETLGLEYEWKETHPLKGDTKTPEYLKINPQHTIPSLVDDGFIVTDSRAIMMHLVRKYGKEDCSLYPKDLELRSKVEQRLFFDLGNVWSVMGKFFFPILYHNKMYDPATADALKETLQIAQDYIKPTGFIAGTPNMSIADIPFLANYTTFKTGGLVEENAFPGLDAWVTRCSKLVKDYEKTNKKGADGVGETFKAMVKSHQG